MGDRISISFKFKDDESVALFSFNAGRRLVESAEMYLKKLKTEFEEPRSMARHLEYCIPGRIMMDFIHYSTRDMEREDVILTFSLGINARDGDNSDNGHFIFDLTKMAKVYSEPIPGEILKRQVVREETGDYEIKHVRDPWEE